MKVCVKNGVEVVGAGVGFQRIRRVTGYLVGTVDRFNDAKRSEEKDRVKHSVGQSVTIPSCFDRV